jgi:hypothetical protein
VWNLLGGAGMGCALTVRWRVLDAAAAHALIPYDEGSNCEPCKTCDECDICMGPCLAVSAATSRPATPPSPPLMVHLAPHARITRAVTAFCRWATLCLLWRPPDLMRQSCPA